jgi:hypothetical protein
LPQEHVQFISEYLEHFANGFGIHHCVCLSRITSPWLADLFAQQLGFERSDLWRASITA